MIAPQGGPPSIGAPLFLFFRPDEGRADLRLPVTQPSPLTSPKSSSPRARLTPPLARSSRTAHPAPRTARSGFRAPSSSPMSLFPTRRGSKALSFRVRCRLTPVRDPPSADDLRPSAVEAVERSAGLSLLPTELKSAKELCRVREVPVILVLSQVLTSSPEQTIKCEVVVRRFDDAQKKLGGGRPAPQRRQTM